MDRKSLQKLVLVPDRTEAGVTQRPPDLRRLEAADPRPGLNVETRHLGPRLAHVARGAAHLARLGAGTTSGTWLAVTPTLVSHRNY